RHIFRAQPFGGQRRDQRAVVVAHAGVEDRHLGSAAREDTCGARGAAAHQQRHTPGAVVGRVEEGMAFRVNLQWRVLVLMTGGMALVLGLSAYLNDISTRGNVDDDRYTSAVIQTNALAERIDTQQLLNKPPELQTELVGMLRARPEFKQ